MLADIQSRLANIQTNFTSWDWVIVVVYLIIIFAIGVSIKRYISNATDFMVAGRGLKTLLGVATMIGTELGLITVMYSAQKGFTGGFAAFNIALMSAVGTLFVALTGFIVVPLRRMQVMTIPEFYEKRFGRNVRILGGLILALSGILNMGLFLKASSLFITGATGMNSDFALKMIMTVLLLMVLIYTSVGGLVSVVVLDYIQFVILSVGLLFACVMSIKFLGWHNIIDTVSQYKHEAGFNPLVGEQGFGVSYIVWMFFIGIESCAIWQTAVIRACAAESVSVVKKLYAFSSIGFLIRFLIPNFLGICAFVYMAHNPDLKDIFLPQTGEATSDITMQAMPIFIGKIIPAGLIGLITAGMLAAFMSTQDSYLLCWSTVLTQDVIAPLFKDKMSSKARLFTTRIFLVLISIFTLVWGLWYPLGQDLWEYMLISGAIYYTGAFAILFLGLYWKRASKVGAYLALISGFGALLGLSPVQHLFGIDISEATLTLWVIGISTFLMLAGSLVFPDRGPAFKHSDHYKE